jgi:hypothetical protein
MSYSRRQLYALGEPLGDSVTQKKVGGGRIYGGGGGGGSAPSGPTTSTNYTTNIPDYAQPYVMNMLQAGQSQIFTPDMSGFNAYQPYSNNPTDYVAGFSPLQQQAQSSAANLQTPGQYGMATGLTAGAARGSNTLANQDVQAGQNLQNTLTSPTAMSQYMNPYLQNTLAPAEQLLNQNYGIQGAAQQGAATQQGAFGGSRNALQQGLNQQNQMLAQNQLIGNAYNNAYTNAQQQAQNVANVGLAGNQAAASALGQQGAMGNQLANIGSQQLAAQQGIIGTQTQQGALEQSQQQNVINQAVQNYATAQQYPFMQLGLMNSLLRGLPMQQTSVQSYQAQPSALTTGIGAIGALGTANSLFTGKAAGGEIKGLAAGGPIAFSTGDQVRGLPMAGKIKMQLEQMPDTQLQQIMQTSKSEEIRKLAAEVLAEHKMAEQADKTVQPPPPPPQQMAQAAPQQMPMSQGIAAAPAPSMETMATGGIIAFAGNGPEGSVVTDPNFDPRLAPTSKYIDTIKEEQSKAGITGRPYEEYSKYVSDQMAKLPDMEKQARDRSAFQYFTNLMTQTGPFLNAAGKAAVATQPDIEKRLDKAHELGAQYNKAKADITQAGRLEDLGMVKDANAMRKEGVDILNRKDVAEIGARASMAATMRPTDLDKDAQAYFNDLVKNQGMDPKDPATMRIARQKAREGANPYAQGNLDLKTEALVVNAEKVDGQLKALNTQLTFADDADKPAILEQIKTRKQQIRNDVTKAAPKPGEVTPTPIPTPDKPIMNADGTVTIPSGPKKGTYEQLPDGTYKKVG